MPSPNLLFICLLLLLTAGCATDRPPSGGPPDTAPLQITEAEPEALSTNIRPGFIRFTFNRYVTTASLRRSIVFSPDIKGYAIRSTGQEAFVIFNEPFEPDRTYSISFNKSLKSSRGNELDRSYTYAFSTGPDLDSGEISGIVYTRQNKPATGALVYAFLVQSRSGSPEKPVPERHPDYVVQTGIDGSFRFNHLKTGSYRLIAFMDADGNRVLDIDREWHAAGSIEYAETGSGPLLFRMTSTVHEKPPATARRDSIPEPAEPGAIIGTIRSPRHPAVIEAVNTATGRWYRTTVRSSPLTEQPFLLTGLPAGSYLVSAYLPKKESAAGEKDLQWDPGSISPFRPADHLLIHPDPVTVRKGWTTGNITLDLRTGIRTAREK